MYLKWTSEFIKFLGDKDHTIEDVLAHLVLSVMAPLKATSAFVSQLDNQNSITTIGRFGIPNQVSSSYEERFALSDKLPITDAINQRRIVAVSTLPQWPKEYSKLLNQPYQSEDSAFVAFPIERSGTPVAVAAVFFKDRIDLNPEIELFIESIANLLAMYLHLQAMASGKIPNSDPGMNAAQHSDLGIELTQRQLLILRMISEGRTNVSISEMLQYSESTIRQETIKIFSKLGCDGREEATELYNKEQSRLKIVD